MALPCKEHSQKSKGYGTATWKGISLALHRKVYCLHNNVSMESIKGLVVRHVCDNMRCIEPTHLLIGTQKQNIADMFSRGRAHKRAGEDSPLAKLDWDTVRYIRETYVPHSRVNGGAALARRFGVDQSIVSEILSGKRWKEEPSGP